MLYPKSAEQAIFEWMPPLPFYSLGQSKYICTRIFWTQLELKQNVVGNTLIERENLWIKPYIRLIKIEYHFSGTHFEKKNSHIWGGLLHYGSCPNFRMDLVCKIPCWGHITGSHTVLKPYRWTYWPLTPLHDTDVLPLMSIFNLLVNENDFQYQSNATDSWNLVILHSIRHFTDTINTIIKSWNTRSWWSLEVKTPPLEERPFLDLIISRDVNCK